MEQTDALFLLSLSLKSILMYCNLLARSLMVMVKMLGNPFIIKFEKRVLANVIFSQVLALYENLCPIMVIRTWGSN